MYANLHSHSYYSIMDGFSSPEEMVIRAKELGMPALAITDHGTLSGTRDFQKAAQTHGVKPILGCEMYLSPTDRFDRRAVKTREDDTQNFHHLIVLGKNAAGYKSLSAMSTTAWREGFYSKPRIDKDLLEEHASGLIVLSGCMNGIIAKAIEKGNMDEAVDHTRWFKDTFGSDFYMEIQSHNPPELNNALLDLSKRFDVKPVVTLDCHFTTARDRAAEELLLILSTKPKVDASFSFQKSTKMDIWERLNYIYPERPISFEHLDLYLMEIAELRASLEVQGLDADTMINNTLEIVDKIGEYDRHEGVNLLPTPKSDPYTLLSNACFEELFRRGLGEEYETRLREELPVIKDKDFAAYFLVVADIVAFAKSQGILVGPGRGSAAGSLINYLLGITGIDPVKHKLLFGRFINAERNDYPDIDIDFQDDRRSEVKEYIYRKFKNVATVSTFAYFRGAGTVRDVSRVFRIPIPEVDVALKNVDTLDDFYHSTDKAVRDFKEKYPVVEEYCRQLQGRIRSVGMHAAGVVVSKEPIDKYAPIEYRKDPDSVAKEMIPVVALDKDSVEELGLLKIDALGLKALSVIATAIKNIEKSKQLTIDPESIPLDDHAIYQMLSEGHTRAVFQAEAGPYTHTLKRMVVSNFDELAASTALIRPGAMNTIGEEYIERKHNRRPTIYANAAYRDITEETYGVIVYQEQVMQAMTDLAGMSMSKADKVRKIIGKKKDASEFDEYKEAFLEGAVSHGKLDPKYAEKLWHDFEAHAGYSFNKSHAVAYSYITYWSAWFKYYYPTEYMAATLAHEEDKKSLTTYLLECRRLGIKIMLPHINRSQRTFAIDGDGIRFGLINIRFIADAAAAAILKNAPYKNYAEFKQIASAKGSGLSSRIIGALNKVNASSFVDNPRADVRENMYEYLGVPYFDDSWMTEETRKRLTPASQYEEGDAAILYGMVIEIKTKPGASWTRIEIVGDSGAASFFSGANPPVEEGKMYAILAGNKTIMGAVEISDVASSEIVFARYLRAKAVNLADNQFLVLDFIKRRTKAGKNMANAVVVDSELRLKHLLVFPTQFPLGMKYMVPGSVVEMQMGYTKEGAAFVDKVRGV